MPVLGVGAALEKSRLLFSQRERGSIMGLWCTNYALGGFIATIFAAYAAQLWGWRFALHAPLWCCSRFGSSSFFSSATGPRMSAFRPSNDITRNQSRRLSRTIARRRAGGLVESGGRSPAQPHGPVVGRRLLLHEAGALRDFVMGTEILERTARHERYPVRSHRRAFRIGGPGQRPGRGGLSDKLFRSRRIPISVLCLIGMSALLFAIDKLPVSKMWFGACLFLMGLLIYAPDSLVSGTAAVDFGTKKGASTASGLINGCGSVGAILGGTIPGFFERSGAGTEYLPCWQSRF